MSPSHARRPGESKRKVPRANVQRRLKGVFVRCPGFFGQRELKVLNISELGIGLDRSTLNGVDPGVFSGRAEFDAQVLVGTAASPVRIRCIHLSDKLIGFEFVEPSDILRSLVNACFEAELLGSGLNWSEGAGAAQNDLRDASGNSIVYSLNGEKVRSLEIQLLGNRVAWKEGASVAWEHLGRWVPLVDSLRKQLVLFVQNATALEGKIIRQLESILRAGSSA